MKSFRRRAKILLELWLCVWLAGLGLPFGIPATRAQTPTADLAIDNLIAGMSVEERVGQLFLVTFIGDDVAPPSDIAELIQVYRVSGVVLLASNGNIHNSGETPAETAALVNALQSLALEAPAITTAYPEALGKDQHATMVTHLPLFVAIDHEGDGAPYTRLINGFTAVPSSMAIGAAWSDELAQSMGEIVGRELSAVGINMLLGPSLDVLDNPRPGVGGDLGTRTFGGDPFWVGRLGEAYIRGVHVGSGSRVATVAKHFPGHGGSDRRADEEVATVNKSLQELYRIELAPFFAATRKAKLGSPSATDALMTSHIRYRGFQGNIRQLTRPISFDAQNLPALMRLPEFEPWRQAGGLLVSDALGVPAVRKYYDPQLQTFPYRQIAQEALLAGNDLLTLSQFALNDTWGEQFENIKATIAFFQDKYVNDEAFRARVDESLRRILQLKLHLYPDLSLESVSAGGDTLSVLGQGGPAIAQLAKSAVTLIYPGPDELADRLPSPPLPDESIVIFSDARPLSDCADAELCPPSPAIEPEALQNTMLQLYGPTGSGQIVPENVHSLTFSDLSIYLGNLPESQTAGSPPADRKQAVEKLITEAKWIVFAMLDQDTERDPDADALRQFLRVGEPRLRGKNLIVFAFREPYYLDTTEISKLTAYYGLYSRMPAFLEVAVRTLFQEVTPNGASPVTITGVNYDLITITEADPDQIIQINLGPTTTSPSGTPTPVGISVGGTLQLATSPILDQKGHIVPDGTPVEFRLYYSADMLELPRVRTTTINGIAEASVVLERTGQLNVTASSGNAQRSTTLQVTIEGNQPALIATVLPSPTVTPRPTHTPRPTLSPTPSRTFTPSPPPLVTPTATPAAMGSRDRSARWGEFALSVLLLLFCGVAASAVRGSLAHSWEAGLRLLTWVLMGGLSGYLIFALGWAPIWLHGAWGGVVVTLFFATTSGGMSLILVGRRQTPIKADRKP